MKIDLLFRCIFQIRRLFRQQPITLIMVLVSGFLLIGASLGYGYAQINFNQVEQVIKAAQSTYRVDQTKTSSGQNVPVLPIFDSAQLASSLYDFADETKLNLDEINYSLDDTENQPYLRYRINLTVTNNYQSIRQFVTRFQSELTHSTLDAINCNRENITSGSLNCDLALSVFYRKTSRG